MLGKLGDLLNKDVGALVKDAGKVLNTDVGTLAKGAGKVLNADLGDLLRDPGSTSDATASDAAASEAAAKTAPDTAAAATPESKVKPASPAAPSQAPTPIQATPAPSAPATSTPPPAFDPDATQKLDPKDEATVVMGPGGGKPGAPPSSTLPMLADSLVMRHTRPMPTGTSLLVLLPHSAGEFVRPHATPVGELTSDPVLAMYSMSGHPVAVRLVQCWDEEEARDRLKEVKVQAGNNFRMANDGTWILGETLQGLVFSWTRGNYSFTATAPKGEVSMVRFLFAFPY